MTEEELKRAEELLSKIESACADLAALPVAQWGQLIDTERDLNRAQRYLKNFITLWHKRKAEV